MDVSQAQEAKLLRDENTRLRKLVADLSLDKDMLQAVIAKNGWGLVDQWSDTLWLLSHYAASERRVCGLMGMAHRVITMRAGARMPVAHGSWWS